MEGQKRLFEIVKSKIPGQYRLVDVLEELLGVSTDAVYKRIRGKKELSFSELQKICEKFKLSMDEVLNYKSNQGALFQYAPVNFSEQESYFAYCKRMLETLTFFKSAQEKEVYYTAQDIPFFYFFDFPELMFFKLYAWNDTVSRTPISYDAFCERLDKNTILSLYKQMANAWQLIPSKEIWSNQTIDTILRLVEYYYDIGAFDKKETVLYLLNQLTALMETVKKNADEGCKQGDMQTPFSLYLCFVDFENNFMLIKREAKMSCTIRLFTVNSIVTDNEALCSETARWIDDLISKSILISGTSNKERIRFFLSSKNKIDGLMNKVELS
jgi:DNA-binding Xre family transcriptional regulator